MKIQFAGQMLVDHTDNLFDYSDPTAGAANPEIVPCPDSDAPFLIDNGNTTQTLSFAVQKEFSTHEEAQRVQLIYEGELPRIGAVVIATGEAGDTLGAVYSAVAIRAPLKIERDGVRLTFTYELTCQPFTSDVPSGLVLPTTVRFTKRIAMSSGATQYDWSYPSSFPTGDIPAVFARLSPKTGDPLIEADALSDNTDESHALISFGAALPTGDYFLNVSAEFTL